MGYTDITIRVSVDMIGPLYIILGSIVLQHPIIQCRKDIQAKGMPQHIARLPYRPACYALGMPQCITRPPRVRESISVFGCSCVHWCATSLVRGSVRVAIANQHQAQHATLLSTAQHTCGLHVKYHNKYSIYTQHFASNNWGTTWTACLETLLITLLGLDN